MGYIKKYSDKRLISKKKEKYSEKKCRTKVVQNNVLYNMLPYMFLFMTPFRS